MARATPTEILSHWHVLIENLQASPKEFYAAVEAAIQRREIPEARNLRVDWREGGLYSAWREYLRIDRGKHVFDLCGAPFGTGFFVSWWLGEAKPNPLGPTLAALGVFFFTGFFFLKVFGAWPGFLFWFLALLAMFWGIGMAMSQGEDPWVPYVLAIPGLGWLWEQLFHPTTYYRYDTALMFQEAVRAAVREVVDGLTQAQGLRVLSESEHKPIMRDLLRR